MTNYLWSRMYKAIGKIRTVPNPLYGFRNVTIDEIIEMSFPELIPFEIYYTLNFIKTYKTNYQLTDEEIEWDIYFLNHSPKFYRLKGFYSNEFEEIDKYMEDWKKSIDSMDVEQLISSMRQNSSIIDDFDGDFLGWEEI